jgi:glycosyltransferase involved in cell wall biosynthesis
MNDQRVRIVLGINSRYTRVTRFTGVQNWASKVIAELEEYEHLEVKKYTPPLFFSHGLRGHLWEQLILPFLARKSDILFSPCNSGPIFFKKQLVCVHDAMVFTNPKLFDYKYRTISKMLLKSYSARRVRIVTVSEESIQNLRKVTSPKMHIVLAGMGITNLQTAFPNLNRKRFFLFVGGDIERKNLSFLLRIWKNIFESTGFELLVITGNNSKSVSKFQIPETEGVRFHLNPTNSELAKHYSECTALLWPSIAEGFGMPLLEAMAFGKPYISAPVGAATELRAGNSKVLPLEHALWQREIILMSREETVDSHVQIQKSRDYTWENVGKAINREILNFFD